MSSCNFFKSLAVGQNEKNNIPAEFQGSQSQGKFKNSTHNIKADTVSQHNIFIMLQTFSLDIKWDIVSHFA